ncbi:MAG: NUDIX hydrolase [Desulfohalobiaceae bacterium]|nr:NUDIX hydrolase [Desulfohalobiaceae bacterium]
MKWLEWARELQALGQIGETFSRNEHEKQNFQRLQEIAAEIVAEHTCLDQQALLGSFSVQPGYATAKIDVRGAALSRGRVLLVRERSDGKWCLPGGWADVGEMPSEMVAREVLEESGFMVRPCKVIGVFDANREGRPMEFFHAYKIIFLCEITGGQARSSVETSAVDFFSFDDLPPLSFNRTNKRHLDEVEAHIREASRPAAFD